MSSKFQVPVWSSPTIPGSLSHTTNTWCTVLTPMYTNFNYLLGVIYPAYVTGPAKGRGGGGVWGDSRGGREVAYLMIASTPVSLNDLLLLLLLSLRF